MCCRRKRCDGWAMCCSKHLALLLLLSFVRLKRLTRNSPPCLDVQFHHPWKRRLQKSSVAFKTPNTQHPPTNLPHSASQTEISSPKKKKGLIMSKALLKDRYRESSHGFAKQNSTGTILLLLHGRIFLFFYPASQHQHQQAEVDLLQLCKWFIY